jgi:hypothetical protein
MGIDPKGENLASVVSNVYNKSLDARGEGIYSLIGDEGVNFLSKVGSGYYYGTPWIEGSMNMYQEKYTQSVVNRNPDYGALIGYGITSMWTKDTYLTTAYTLASFGKVASAVASNATNISTTVLGKTTGLGIVDMRTVLGRGIKAVVNGFNAGKDAIAGIAAFDASMKSGNYYDAIKNTLGLIK